MEKVYKNLLMAENTKVILWLANLKAQELSLTRPVKNTLVLGSTAKKQDKVS